VQLRPNLAHNAALSDRRCEPIPYVIKRHWQADDGSLRFRSRNRLGRGGFCPLPISYKTNKRVSFPTRRQLYHAVPSILIGQARRLIGDGRIIHASTAASHEPTRVAL
jgi:hypothetical protein